MGLLNYFAPNKAKKEADEKNAVADHGPATITDEKALEMTTSPGSSGDATPYGSRPASLFPVGDFRNSQAGDITEIKCDVMVNWLYQQQMERLWTAGGHDEGVVLKKGRGAYTCCPADIVSEPFGFFRAVETLNVKVRLHPRSIGEESLLTWSSAP